MTEAEAMEPIEEDAPAGHYYVTIKGRRILIKDINEAQSLMLGGYLKQINGEVNFDLVMDIFGKLFILMDNLVVNKDDMKWLEEKILTTEILIGDFATIFHSHAPVVPKVAAPKKPRRGK